MGENEKVVGAPVEGPIVVWSDWMSPNGQRWSVTMRAGCTGEAMAMFAGEVTIAETLLIGAGWEPTDRKGPLAWPPADKEAARQAEIKELAARIAIENAQVALEPTLLKLARHSLVRAAVALGVMKSPTDEEGAAEIKASAKAAGLGDELVPDKLGDWVFQVGVLAAAKARAANGASGNGGAKAEQKPKPERKPAAKRPAREEPDEREKAGGGGTIQFDRIEIGGKKDSPRVEFWREGRQYAEVTWSLSAEALLEMSPSLADALDEADLLDVGSTYNVGGTVEWEPSENLNSKGKFYKDIVGVSVA